MQRILKFIPNIITASRIIMSALFVSNVLKQFRYGQEKILSIAIIFFLICLSDLIDGYIARKSNCTSRMGAKLDIFADLFFIVSSYVTLVILRIMPLWFLVFVCLKFIEFLYTSNFIKKCDEVSAHPFIFDKLGRIVSAMFFIVPGIICYSRFSCTVNFLLYIILILGVLSSYLRIKECFEWN
ncbi:MAG: CDP-alcohol phosphatidyltransferase family protein [Clostridiales bacterium]|nr:CDP-alcohol phosphatidyltransferase family protein [Clostridiales bacterium]